MERRFRLRANADFRRVRREGQSWSNRWLVLVRAPNQSAVSRFGFAIGKKLGGAVVRNRLKRQLREVTRLQMRQGGIVPGFDVVVIARQPAVGAPFATLDTALTDLLDRAGLIQKRDEPGVRGQVGGGQEPEGELPGHRPPASGPHSARGHEDLQEPGP